MKRILFACFLSVTLAKLSSLVFAAFDCQKPGGKGGGKLHAGAGVEILNGM